VRVSVVITSFDGMPYLATAVQSVLTQTHRALECIVVDDASRDTTADYLSGIGDPRLVVIRAPRNEGPFAAANRGLERATGDVIARLDADDECVPRRLEAQVAFLNSHTAVGLVGSECVRIDERGTSLGRQPVPERDLAIRLRCMVSSPFIHSSVMWRRELGLRYDATMRLGGDYELWTRALQLTQAANVPQPLVRYRVWARSLSSTRSEEQRTIHDELAARWSARQWPTLGIDAATVRELREWSAAGKAQPLPLRARRVVDALQRAVLGPSPSEAALESFARSLFTPPGAYGQPAPQA
jgi:glycosyltransferase involved in cell wall biosynthesis